MTDPLDSFLDRATAAARKRAETNVDDGAATRLRIRETLAAGRPVARSRKRLLTIISAIVGSLFGSFAFAAYVTGWNPLAPKAEPPPTSPVASVDTPAKRPVRRTAPATPATPTMPDVSLPARIEPDAAVVIEAPPAPSTAVELPAPPAPPAPPAQPAQPAQSTQPAQPAPLAPNAPKTVAKADVPSAPKPLAKAKPRTTKVARVDAEAPRTAAPAAPAPAPVPQPTTTLSTQTPSTSGPSTASQTTPAPSTSAPSAPSAPAPSTPAPTAPSPTAPSPTAPYPSAPSRPSPATPAPPKPLPAKSDDLAAYRVAHEAHFRGTEMKAALAAWDAYLAKHAQSQLAPDARYNRALVLIKLARYAEARRALVPFASAPAGSYRQAEAAKLIAALPTK